MSELKVNKISPRDGTAFTLGDSGDTFTVPVGANIVNSGTATGFGGGATALVSSATANDTAEIIFTIDTTQYNTYLLRMENVVATSNGASGRFQFGDTNGYSTSMYSWVQVSHNTGSHAYSNNGGSGLSHGIMDTNMSSFKKESFNANIWISAPSAADLSTPMLQYNSVYINSGGTLQKDTGIVGMPNGNVAGFNMTHLKFYLMNTQNIKHGRFYLYGLSQS